MEPPPSEGPLSEPLLMCGNVPFDSPTGGGAALPASPSEAGSRQGGGNKWKAGTTIHVGFRDPAGDPWIDYFRGLVRDAVAEWQRYANLNFQFVEGRGHITVTFIGGSVNTLNSRLGTDSTLHDPSMYLHFQRNNAAWYVTYMKAMVLHEFGHALGMYHEHQLPRSGVPFRWTPDFAAHYRSAYPQATPEYIRDQIETPVAQHLLSDWVTFDPTSIMIYPIPAGCAVYTDGTPMVIPQNNELSQGDRHFIARMYPGRYPTEPGGAVPTTGVVTVPPPVPPTVGGTHPDPNLTLGAGVDDFLDAAGQVRRYYFALPDDRLVRIRTARAGRKVARLFGPDSDTAEFRVLGTLNDGNLDAVEFLPAARWCLTIGLDGAAVGPFRVEVGAG